MGARQREIENGLYGFKGDLKDGFDKNDVPRWLSPKYPRKYGGEQDITRDMRAGRFLQAHREEQREGRAFTNSTTVGLEVDTNRAPARIADKIAEYGESTTHQRMLDRLVPGEWFDGYHLEVTVGSRGGIQDVRLIARYKD